MIISASRRCDIPNYKSDWFFDSLKNGKVVVPINQFLSKPISLAKEDVDCFVFWTKNPEPMLKRLNELNGYPFYFQFTLTGYSKKIEPGVPDKHHTLSVFQELSRRTSPRQVIWRYDPIFFSETYTMEYHKKAFQSIAEALEGYTERCVISFIDLYGKITIRVVPYGIRAPRTDEIMELVQFISEAAGKRGIRVETCAEKIDLSCFEIYPTHCIDAALISQLTGKDLSILKDPSQRAECGCCKSVDIGNYHTCKNGCVYCYAN